MKRRLTCILAADAVGYSQHMAGDEEGTIRILAAHRAVIDGVIAFHSGRILSTAGDSVLAEFGSAVEAVRCAVEIQDALRTRNDALPEDRRLLFRVGVNLGDVVVKNDDLLGDGVNVAARLESIAEPGGICISSSVYDQITGKLDLGFLDIGEQTLKNISRPIRVFRVSGANAPARAAMAERAAAAAKKPAGKSMLPAAIAFGIAIVAGVVAWQAGWLRVGAPDVAKTAQAPNVAPAPAGVPAAEPARAQVAQVEGDRDRLRAEAEALKRQAEAELSRVRSEVEAGRAARSRADAEAAAAKTRAQAETDAARIRAEAETSAARARAEVEAARKSAASETARASPPTKADASKADSAAPAVASAIPPPGRAATAGGDMSAFDGAWSVTVSCPPGDGAQGYTLDFIAQVKEGYLRGQHLIENSPGSLRLQGQIRADGTAKLDAHGFVGDPKFAITGAVKNAPYSYTVDARFDASRGSGRRMQLRPCELLFSKR
ncbi:MAG: adenylate/guanylate cyclase domain-containing protein [Betaproteobacteria bacterium]